MANILINAILGSVSYVYKSGYVMVIRLERKDTGSLADMRSTVV